MLGIVSFHIDAAEWEMFKLRAGERKASEQLREFVITFNNSYRANDPDRQKEELKIRFEFAEAEKKYNQLKASIITMETKINAESTEQERKERKLKEILDNAKYNTAKDEFHDWGVSGK
jgi:uncharacterized protein YlxW (UPF0749 family)